jgi:hypothetical protein
LFSFHPLQKKNPAKVTENLARRNPQRLGSSSRYWQVNFGRWWLVQGSDNDLNSSNSTQSAQAFSQIAAMRNHAATASECGGLTPLWLPCGPVRTVEPRGAVRGEDSTPASLVAEADVKRETLAVDGDKSPVESGDKSPHSKEPASALATRMMSRIFGASLSLV